MCIIFSFFPLVCLFVCLFKRTYCMCCNVMLCDELYVCGIFVFVFPYFFLSTNFDSFLCVWCLCVCVCVNGYVLGCVCVCDCVNVCSTLLFQLILNARLG